MASLSVTDPEYALRVATAMFQHKIAGYPRNYELIFEIYSGKKAELTRDFMALSAPLSQSMLDDLCLRYLPHWFEDSQMASANKQMLDQLSSFIRMLERENRNLNEIDRTLKRATQTGETPDISGLDEILTLVSKAADTAKDFLEFNKSIKFEITNQIQIAESIRRITNEFESMKFEDRVTSFGNRRAFQKRVAQIYQSEQADNDNCLMMMKINPFTPVYPATVQDVAEPALRHVANIIEERLEDGDFAGRLDHDRFVMLRAGKPLANNAKFLDGLCRTVQATPFSAGGVEQKPLTVSAGMAMAGDHPDGDSLIKAAEKALLKALNLAEKPAPAAAPSTTSQHGKHKNRLMYQVR